MPAVPDDLDAQRKGECTLSYVKSALVAGEQIMYEGHFHWIQKVVAVAFCAVLVGIFWIISMWSTDMAITNRRFIYKRGWIARTTEEMSLHRIEKVNLRQGIIGRIFGYGRVQVQGMGGGGIRLPNIGSPMRFKRELDEAKARAERARD